MIGVEVLLQSTATKLAPAVAKFLVGSESKTNRQLTRIENSVDALLLGPYREAGRYLETASLPGLDTRKRDKNLKLAIKKLIVAESQLSSTQHWRIAHDAQLSVAIINYTNADETGADYWARAAHRTALKGIESLLTEANHRMGLTIGRLRIFGRRGPLVALAAMVLWVAMEAVGAGGVLSRLPVTFTGLGLAFLFYMEARFHYRTATAWWFRRGLRSQLEFLREQADACRALLLPGSPALEGAYVETVDDGEAPVSFVLRRVVDGPAARRSFVEAVAAYVAAAQACSEQVQEMQRHFPDGLVRSSTLKPASVPGFEEGVRLHAAACHRLSRVFDAYGYVERAGDPVITEAATRVLSLFGEPSEPHADELVDATRPRDPPPPPEPDDNLDPRVVELMQEHECDDVAAMQTLVMASMTLFMLTSRHPLSSDSNAARPTTDEF